MTVSEFATFLARATREQPVPAARRSMVIIHQAEGEPGEGDWIRPVHRVAFDSNGSLVLQGGDTDKIQTWWEPIALLRFIQEQFSTGTQHGHGHVSVDQGITGTGGYYRAKTIRMLSNGSLFLSPLQVPEYALNAWDKVLSRPRTQ